MAGDACASVTHSQAPGPTQLPSSKGIAMPGDAVAQGSQAALPVANGVHLSSGPGGSA
jgi:hypothetical protein